MATYFDSTAPADKNLLRPGSRTNTDLANVAAEAEKDVIEHYTRAGRSAVYTSRAVWQDGSPVLVNATLGLYVFLAGYREDAADAAVDADLKDALRREIAGVIDWRIMQRDVNTLAMSESDGTGKSVSLRGDANAVFPPGFGRRLRNFDLREPTWGS